MTVIIRFDPTEHVFRSAGETTPGILGVGETPDGDWSLTITSAWAPSKDMIALGNQREAEGAPPTGIIDPIAGWDDATVPVDVETVIDGCVDLECVAGVLKMAQETFVLCWAMKGLQGNLESVRRCIDFVEEVYRATSERFNREAGAET